MFWVVPFGFSLLFWFPYWFWKENQRKTIRKPIPADSGTSPELPSGPLPPLSQPAPGLLLRDFPWVSPCRLASSGLLWLALAPSLLENTVWAALDLLWAFLFHNENERKTNRKPSPAVSQASPELILLSSLLRTCTRQVSSESHCCVYAQDKWGRTAFLSLMKLTPTNGN